jgi:hypothetical protein
VTEEDAADPVHVQLLPLRQAGKEGTLRLVQALATPPRLRPLSGLRLRNLTIDIPTHPEHLTGDRAQTSKRLDRLRTGDHVAPDHDHIDRLTFKLCQHRLKRREHAVDVVQRSNTHQREHL